MTDMTCCKLHKSRMMYIYQLVSLRGTVLEALYARPEVIHTAYKLTARSPWHPKLDTDVAGAPIS